jgi:dTDP-4-amino-4,6-dideoxygalactose transaminase
MFYIVLKDLATRDRVIAACKEKGLNPVFHYLSLNKSPFYSKGNPPTDLVHSDHFTDCLLRLPLYYELQEADALRVADTIQNALALSPASV